MIDEDSPDGPGQGQWKTFWKGVTILDAIKSICDSWEKLKISIYTGVWKVIPALMNDPEEFKGSAEEVTADVGRTARDLPRSGA